MTSETRPPAEDPAGQLEPLDQGWRWSFSAFGGPCEIQFDHCIRSLAVSLGQLVQNEALRIQHKYSRYEEDSLLSQINREAGQPIQVDQETAGLLEMAALSYRVSGGAFDITSGILARAWDFRRVGEHFNQLPENLAALRKKIGWSRLHWQNPDLCLQPGMELDLGGLGKEYAVDRCRHLLEQDYPGGALINFGGDLAICGQRSTGEAWRVAVEALQQDQAPLQLECYEGALATSGDSRRYIFWRGQRVSHILDARSSLPVPGAPHSITVAAATCSEAGLLATLAMLKGIRAEDFLKNQSRQYWIQR